jgi:RNA binding exosome subunit
VIVIRSIDVRFVSHATEDEARLQKAAEHVFAAKFSMKTTKGHWDNPIRVFSSRLTGAAAEKLLRRVASAVPVRDFGSCCDGSDFYVRVGKAALLRGALEPGDDVQLHVKLRLPKGHSAAHHMREFWKV